MKKWVARTSFLTDFNPLIFSGYVSSEYGRPFWLLRYSSWLPSSSASFKTMAGVPTSPLHIVWRYIVMQLSYHFQNIVKISLSHFFGTISHDIYLISTYTESSHRCLLVKLFLDESGTKSQNIPSISDH